MRIVFVAESGNLQCGAVQRSVGALVRALRQRGHDVLLVAPAPVGSESNASDPATVLLPAIPVTADGTLGISVPWSATLAERLESFRPEIVHVHHALVVGGVALRMAAESSAPLVYSFHDRQEATVTPAFHRPSFLRRLAEELTIDYGRFADAVLAPNHAVATFLHDRGVDTALEIAPTGVDMMDLARASRNDARDRCGVPQDAFVVGHVGALDTNADGEFLLTCLARFLHRHAAAHCLLVSDGNRGREAAPDLAAFGRTASRTHLLRFADGFDPRDGYAAMDVFATASHTRLQSMEAIEALAAAVPVVSRESPAARDVVVDQQNGRLLNSGSRRAFVAALEQLATAAPSTRRQLGESARSSVERFRVESCSEQILGLYGHLMETARKRKPEDPSEWETARERLELEGKLWGRRARAAGMALLRSRHPSRIPFLRHVIHSWRTFRHWISRREWSVRLLDLPVWEGATDEPGLIVLQIDGLARPQLERALEAGRMPFVRRLLTREAYHVHTMYPGQPTTTPAVLGELFYGVEQAVPAFGFRDHRTGDVVQMFQPGIAARVQRELSHTGEGLLSDGCAYSVIYSGGAADSSFCPATTGWRNIEDVAMWRRFALFLLNVMSLLRIAGLSVIELCVALYAGVRGVLRGHDLWREVLYVPRRVIVNVVLRELLAISAEADATRGVPVVYANFLGYDENAHRRGPEARFAHHALQGIDRALRRIWNAAHASARRNYHVWIVSDHGQERSVPYSELENRTIDEAVCEVFQGFNGHAQSAGQSDPPGLQAHRSSWLRTRSNVAQSPDASTVDGPSKAGPTTVAIGPLGYVYWPTQLGSRDKDRIARRLVAAARVPLVLADVDGIVLAWTRSGRHRMPEEATRFLASDHPFLADTARDLARLCAHPDAGDFLICGWRNDAPPISFVSENGAHGGPGPHECSGFAILPPDVPPPPEGTFRPRVLRDMARRVLRRGPTGKRARSVSANRTPAKEDHIRIVTYNIHSCIGLDGRLSPSRIARVLAMTSPDVVALQEVDVRRDRSGLIDQAELIAHALEMELDFHPSFEIEEGQYGNAILSRLPMRRRRAAALPRRNRRHEPRAALWVEVEVGGRPLNVLMAHLGTSASERVLQVEELLGPHWLQHPDCRSPAVLCGDFNVLPGSRAYRRLTAQLRDVQVVAEGHHPLRTWFSPFPLTRIDHIFLSNGLRVSQVYIPRTSLARVASDHLPLAVDLQILASREHESLAGESASVNA